MSTLDEVLRVAVSKGLTHLTLYPVPSDDGKKIYWCARATPSTGHQYISASDLDPIKVLVTVLENLPRAKKRAGVTAAVTEPAIDTNRGSTYAPGADDPTGLHPELESEIDKWLPKT